VLLENLDNVSVRI